MHCQGWECVNVLDNIGPALPGARSSDGSVVVTFVGNFAPTVQLTTLSEKYLLVPDDRTLTPAQALSNQQIVVSRGQIYTYILNQIWYQTTTAQL